MADETGRGDQNHYRVIMAVTNDSNQYIRQVRVDPNTGYLLTGGTIQTSGYNTVTSGSFTTTTTSGVQLISISTPCKKVTVICPIGNTGQIAVGGSNVSAATNSEIGHVLLQGASSDFYIQDASNLFISLNMANDRAVYNIWN